MSATNGNDSVFERHAQTIISAVVLALLAWTGTTLLDVRERLTRIEAIKLTEAGSDLRVANDIANIRTEIALNRDRLHAIEVQLAKSEKKP